MESRSYPTRVEPRTRENAGRGEGILNGVRAAEALTPRSGPSGIAREAGRHGAGFDDISADSQVSLA